MASSDHGAQKPIRVRGCQKCPHHSGKQVVYNCENCKELACATCVSTVHKGHDLEELAYIVPNSKTKIQDFISKSENDEIPRIKRKIRNVDNEMSQQKQHYQQEISHIEKQNEIVKEALDTATRKLVKSYRDMERQAMEMLHKHKTELQAQVDEWNSQIQEYKDTLQSGNDAQVYDVSCNLPAEFKDMQTLTLPAPSFTPGKFTLQQLEKLVGEVTRKESRIDLNQLPYQAANYRVVTKFSLFDRHWIPSIHPTSDNKVWISLSNYGEKKRMNKMLLINNEGEVQQTLDMEVDVYDFDVSPGSGILWFCSLEDDTVREIRGGGSVVRFTTKRQPGTICLTADDHVVVGHVGEVVKYTQTGKVVHKTSGGDELLIKSPTHISHCSITGRFAVLDLHHPTHGGSDHPVVWILDDHLNHLYKYCGDTPGGQPLTKPFFPSDICYTANRSLVITDVRNKSVLLVNEKGEFLQTLYTHNNFTTASVCVHHDGVIWVTFEDCSVSLLKCMRQVHQ